MRRSAKWAALAWLAAVFAGAGSAQENLIPAMSQGDARISSSLTYMEDVRGAWCATDPAQEMGWVPVGSSGWIRFDFPEAIRPDTLYVQRSGWYAPDGGAFTRVKLEASADGSLFVVLLDTTAFSDMEIGEGRTLAIPEEKIKAYRTWRISFETGAGQSLLIGQVGLYGTTGGGAGDGGYGGEGGNADLTPLLEEMRKQTALLDEMSFLVVLCVVVAAMVLGVSVARISILGKNQRDIMG